MSLPAIHHRGARITMVFAHQKASDDDRAYYHISTLGFSPWCTFPHETDMERLAHKFLHSPYIELERTSIDCNRVTFAIDAHIPAEDRAAFLAAVTVHTVIESSG